MFKTMIFKKLNVLLCGLLVGTSALAADVVKIGFTGPLSGGGANYGKNILDGMRFAVDEINASNAEVAGKPIKLEVVALDDKYSPSDSAINVRRLVQEHKTPVVLVGHSGGTYAAQTANERQKVLLLSYTSMHEVVTRGNKLTVRIAPAFDRYLTEFVKYSIPHHGKKAAIASADHDYAKVWNTAFKKAWTEAGGEIVADNPMSYTRSTDFYSGMSKVLVSNPDVIFVGGPSEATGLVIKQARELGYKGGFILIDQARIDEAAQVAGGLEVMEGAIGVMPLSMREGAENFIKRFNEANPGRIVGTEMALSYISIYSLLEAMKLAGTTTDAAAIRAQYATGVKQLDPVVNVYDLSHLDENGGVVLRPRVTVIKNGEIVEVTP